MPTPATPATSISSPFRADCPLFITTNALSDTTNLTPRWTTDGTSAGTDITVSSQPTSNAYDGKGELATYAAGTLNTVYFNFELNNTTVDACAILFPEPLELSTVTVQLSNNSTFTGTLGVDYYNLATFTSITGTLRRVGTSLPSTTYTGTRYGRIRFVRDGGGNYASLPRIGEFYIGAASVLSKGWDFGSDTAPRAAVASEFVAEHGSRFRDSHRRGFRKFRHSFEASTSGRFGANDVSTIRSLHANSEDGTRPILYVPNPTSALGTAYLGYVPIELNMPREDFGEYAYEFAFDETRPFFLRES